MTPATAADPTTATVERIRAAVGSRYHLERELGRGGMGSVYLSNPRAGRCVVTRRCPELWTVRVPRDAPGSHN